MSTPAWIASLGDHGAGTTRTAGASPGRAACLIEPGAALVPPRTVQTHISHVLRKFGLSSRVEIAAEVVRRRPV